MKSAEEWSKELGEFWVHCQGADESYRKISPEQVRKIQADALYHAAEIIGDLPKTYSRMRAWDGPYRAACVFGRSHLREQATDLTRALQDGKQ